MEKIPGSFIQKKGGRLINMAELENPGPQTSVSTDNSTILSYHANKIIIAVVVLIAIAVFLLFEVYRNVLTLVAARTEAPPPPLRLRSFLPEQSTLA